MGKRRQKEKEGEQVAAWLITFSDLVTLLLTFFVLLLSMSSMDRSVLTKVNMFTEEIHFMTYRGAGRVPQRIRLLIDLLENPIEVTKKPNRFKDLLFPDDILSKEIDRSTLEENMHVLKRPEGVALVLTEKLLFGPGEDMLSDRARQVLRPIAEVLLYMTADVNIAGHADNRPAEMSNELLSGRRAFSVLEFLTELGLKNRRFSVSAYGDSWPIASNATPEGRAQNRRVEILVKTQPRLGGYAS